MQKAILFHGVNSLDFQELRRNALRIPDVLTRVKQAQKIWNDAGLPEFDFVNFIGSEDKVFYANIKFKSLAAAVVQIGLYERYLTKNTTPDILIGDVASDSALLYCTKKTTFPELILSSNAALSMDTGFKMPKNREQLEFSGVGIEKLKAYGWVEEEMQEVDMPDENGISMDHILRKLIDESELKTIINIGPGSNIENLKLKFALEDLLFMESIDCDPMLNWFWAQSKPLEQVIAQ